MSNIHKDWQDKDWQNLALPFVLMITGAILLAGDGFGLLSLDRIQNLWPMAVILVGLADLMPENLDKVR
jgi:hypothetical protein